MLTTAGATIFTTGAKVRLICWVEVGMVSCASAGTAISAVTIRPIRAIQNRIGSLQASFPLPQDGGGLGWGKRAMTVSHRNAASPSLPSPASGEGINTSGRRNPASTSQHGNKKGSRQGCPLCVIYPTKALRRDSLALGFVGLRLDRAGILALGRDVAVDELDDRH